MAEIINKLHNLPMEEKDELLTLLWYILNDKNEKDKLNCSINKAYMIVGKKLGYIKNQ